MAGSRHSLYMVVGKALTQAKAEYHLPPYKDMETHWMQQHHLRPPGGGATFMPPYLRSAAMKP